MIILVCDLATKTKSIIDNRQIRSRVKRIMIIELGDAKLSMCISPYLIGYVFQTNYESA